MVNLLECVYHTTPWLSPFFFFFFPLFSVLHAWIAHLTPFWILPVLAWIAHLTPFWILPVSGWNGHFRTNHCIRLTDHHFLGCTSPLPLEFSRTFFEDFSIMVCQPDNPRKELTIQIALSLRIFKISLVSICLFLAETWLIGLIFSSGASWSTSCFWPCLGQLAVWNFSDNRCPPT